MNEQTALQKRANDLVEVAESMVVTDQESCQVASDFVNGLKPIEAEIRKEFDGPIKKAHDAHKAMVTWKRRHMDKVVEAKDKANLKIEYYMAGQERIRLAAIAKAEAERKERERIKAEKEEQAQREAEAAEESGATEAAEEILEESQEPEPEPEIVVPEKTKIAGATMTKRWTAEVVDLVALCRSIGNGMPSNMVKPNQVVLDQLAREHKDLLTILGVKAVSNSSVSRR